MNHLKLENKSIYILRSPCKFQKFVHALVNSKTARFYCGWQESASLVMHLFRLFILIIILKFEMIEYGTARFSVYWT